MRERIFVAALLARAIEPSRELPVGPLPGAGVATGMIDSISRRGMLPWCEDGGAAVWCGRASEREWGT